MRAAVLFHILFSFSLCISYFITRSLSSLLSPSLSFEVRLDLPGDTCGVDLVNTTSSIVKAKRARPPVASLRWKFLAGELCRKAGTHIALDVGARIFNSVKVLVLDEGTFAATLSSMIDTKRIIE